MKILAAQLHSNTVKKFEYRSHSGIWYYGGYVTERSKARDIGHAELMHAVRHGELIEWHDETGTERVLLRDELGICVVLDLDTRNIITVYRNNVGDNHATLDTCKYAFA